VLDKWSGPSFNDVTRGVLRRRLYASPERRFFSQEEYVVLEAVCARLIPQADRSEPIPIACWIDADLLAGKGDGYRHPDMPPQGAAWRLGLRAIDAEARERYVQSFAGLHPQSQDAVLEAAQCGDAPAFGDLPQQEVFKMMLKAVVGVYYSHPSAWSEVGFGGPASPRGYVRIGLDQSDPWEAPLASAPGDGQ
jgi:hypothetical protein